MEQNKHNLTEEEIRKVIEDIFTSRNREDRTVVLYQQCLTNGWVDRGDVNSPLCDNPKCGACTSFNEAMASVDDQLAKEAKQQGLIEDAGLDKPSTSPSIVLELPQNWTTNSDNFSE